MHKNSTNRHLAPACAMSGKLSFLILMINLLAFPLLASGNSDSRVSLSTADIEVYYEFDNIQVNSETGAIPLIGTASYTVFVKNNGPDEATNLEVQMNYHDEVVVTDRNLSTGTWESYYWAIPDLAAGAIASYTETANIYVPYDQKWVQAFLVASDQDDPDSTPNGASFSEDDADKLEIITELSDIEVSFNADKVPVNQSFGTNPIISTSSYGFTVVNNGPVEATNLDIFINYHDDVIPLNREVTMGTLNNQYWVIPNLPVGAIAHFTETSKILFPYNDKWVMAFLTDADQEDPDSTPNGASFDEDDADRLEIIAPASDLDLTLAVLGDLEFDEYEHVNYEVVVQNFGPDVASNVSVHFPLPDGMVFTSSSAMLGEYNLYYETWNIGQLEIGQMVLLNLELFTLDADAPKKAFAQVQTVDQPDPDSTPGNDTNQVADEDDEAEVTILPEGTSLPDLAVFGLAPIPTGNTSGPSQYNEIYFDLFNIGNGASAANFRIAAYLSTDEVFSPDDAFLGDANFPNSIAGGEVISEWSIDTYVPYDQESGNYFLLFYVDADNSIPEEDEVNNIYVYPFEITGCAGIIDLESQAAVDGFGPCEVFDGTIYISGNDITDFSSFDMLREVNGNFNINGNAALQNINGLYNLETVGGRLTITNNAILEHLDGLINLTEVGWKLEVMDNPVLSGCCGIWPIIDNGGVVGDIIIENNPAFCSSVSEIISACSSVTTCFGDVHLSSQAEVDAFDCVVITGDLIIDGSVNDLSPMFMLEKVEGGLSINNTTVLQNLDGLDNLNSILGEFNLYDNTALVNIDALSNCNGIGGSMTIARNDVLLDVDGLIDIKILHGRLWIIDNAALQNIDGLQNLMKVIGFLGIDNNASLESIGLTSLYQVNEEVAIENNGSLQNIDGLSSLTSVGTWFYIINNDALNNVDGLSNMEYVIEILRISDNDALENLDGLSNFNSIGDLRIFDNATLSNCCGIFPYLDLLPDFDDVHIYNNPAGCSSPEDILMNCAPGDYCTSYGDFPWHEWISQVQINQIDHTSEKSKYSDFTNISTDLEQGGMYGIHLQTGFSYYTFEEYWRIWIDINHDGDFNDPHELILDDSATPPADGTPYGSLYNNINIPASALPGPTRMRISMQRGSAPNSCGVIPFGEVEDYTVNIVSGGQAILSMQCPDDIFINLPEGTAGTNVSWNEPTASTTCPDEIVNLTQTGGQPNGSYFTAGVYFIEYRATDNCNNNSTCTFVLTVQETSGYCESEGEFPWHEWISQVSIGEFSNASGKSNYSDFTDQIIVMEPVQNYPLILQTSYSYETFDEYWSIWIDFNHNGFFEEPSELAFVGMMESPAYGTPSKTFEGQLFIPGDALPGLTRMRVAMKRGDYPHSCETFPFGEVEDYTVEIGEYNNNQNTPGQFNRDALIAAHAVPMEPGEIRLFPNPARHEINLQMAEPLIGETILTIYDGLGQIRLRKEIDGNTLEALSIPIRNFENGIYFMSIQNEKRKIRTKRFIVESRK